MRAPDIHSGYLLDEFPYVCVENGPDIIVILPHIRETLEDITRAGWCTRWLKRFSRRNHSVYILGRKNVLPRDYTTRDMASDCAAVLHKCLGKCIVMGFSLGGLIAQYVAIDHPSLVKSLILAVSAHRIHPPQIEHMKHWIALAEKGEWRQLYLDLASLMHAGLNEDIHEWALPLLNRSLNHTPFNPANFITSVRSSMLHNTTDVLNMITAPTLIIGGTDDRLFPAATFYEAGHILPHARLKLLAGAGHGAFDEQKRNFDKTVLEFISKY